MNNKRKSRTAPQRPPVAAEGVYKNAFFMHAIAAHVGDTVQVHTQSDSIWEGVFRTFSSKFDVVIEVAHRVDRDGTSPMDTLVDKMIFKPIDVVSIKVKDSDLEYATRGTFQTDSAISKYNGRSGAYGESRHLQPWEAETAVLNGDSADCSLEQLELDHRANGWDVHEMFRKNEQKYGVHSTFDHSLAGYTVPLQKKDTQDYREKEAKAEEIAAAIESQPTYKQRMDLENGDEEERYSAVVRPSNSGGRHSRPSPPPLHQHHQSHQSHHSQQSQSQTANGGPQQAEAPPATDRYVAPNKRKNPQTGKLIKSSQVPQQQQQQQQQQPPQVGSNSNSNSSISLSGGGQPKGAPPPGPHYPPLPHHPQHNQHQVHVSMGISGGSGPPVKSYAAAGGGSSNSNNSVGVGHGVVSGGVNVVGVGGVGGNAPSGLPPAPQPLSYPTPPPFTSHHVHGVQSGGPSVGKVMNGSDPSKPVGPGAPLQQRAPRHAPLPAPFPPPQQPLQQPLQQPPQQMVQQIVVQHGDNQQPMPQPVIPHQVALVDGHGVVSGLPAGMPQHVPANSISQPAPQATRQQRDMRLNEDVDDLRKFHNDFKLVPDQSSGQAEPAHKPPISGQMPQQQMQRDGPHGKAPPHSQPQDGPPNKGRGSPTDSQHSHTPKQHSPQEHNNKIVPRPDVPATPPVQQVAVASAATPLEPPTATPSPLDKSNATKKQFTLNPNAKEFNPAAKPFVHRSPNTPNPSRPHTPATPVNQHGPPNHFMNQTVAAQHAVPHFTAASGHHAHHLTPANATAATVMLAGGQGGGPQAAYAAVMHHPHAQQAPIYQQQQPHHRPYRKMMASPMQVAAATGQPLMAPGPLPQYMPYPHAAHPHQPPQHYPPLVNYFTNWVPPMRMYQQHHEGGGGGAGGANAGGVAAQLQYLGAPPPTPSTPSPSQAAYHPPPSPAVGVGVGVGGQQPQQGQPAYQPAPPQQSFQTVLCPVLPPPPQQQHQIYLPQPPPQQPPQHQHPQHAPHAPHAAHAAHATHALQMLLPPPQGQVSGPQHGGQHP